MFKDILVLFDSPPVYIYFAWFMIFGFGSAMIWNFLFWHLEEIDAINSTCNTWMKTLQGLSVFVQCICGQTPMFYLSNWILTKFGHLHTMSIILFGQGMTMYLYSMLTEPVWVLAIEPLHGMIYGLFYSTFTSYASIIAPRGTEATLQVLIYMIIRRRPYIT